MPLVVSVFVSGILSKGVSTVNVEEGARQLVDSGLISFETRSNKLVPVTDDYKGNLVNQSKVRGKLHLQGLRETTELNYANGFIF